MNHLLVYVSMFQFMCRNTKSFELKLILHVLYLNNRFPIKDSYNNNFNKNNKNPTKCTVECVLNQTCRHLIRPNICSVFRLRIYNKLHVFGNTEYLLSLYANKRISLHE